MSTDTADTANTAGPTSSSTTGMWRVVARHELSTQVRSKGFLIQAGVLLVGLVVGIIVLGLVSGHESTDRVGVVDRVGATAVEQGSAIARAADENARLEPESFASASAAEQAVSDGDVDAAVVPASSGGYELIGDSSVDPTIAQAVGTALSATLTEQNAQEQGVDLQALGEGTEVGQRLLDPDADDAGLRQAASLVFVVLFFVTALSFGMTIATSVTQEKESRIVEILAAAVPIRDLLWGKVAGTTVLAIGQTVLLAAAGVIGLVASGRGDALGVLGPAIGWYVAFFVLGFVTLASLWAVAGSLASRTQDVNGATAPVQILLFAPYIVAFVAGEGVRTVVSMLPVVSTMLMPARIAEGSVPVWQLVLAIVVTAAAAVLFVRVGARIYERNLLRTGNRIGLRDALASAGDEGV